MLKGRTFLPKRLRSGCGSYYRFILASGKFYFQDSLSGGRADDRSMLLVVHIALNYLGIEGKMIYCIAFVLEKKNRLCICSKADMKQCCVMYDFRKLFKTIT